MRNLIMSMTSNNQTPGPIQWLEKALIRPTADGRCFRWFATLRLRSLPIGWPPPVRIIGSLPCRLTGNDEWLAPR